MMRLFTALALCGLVCCGGSKTVCDQAVDKLGSCNLPSQSVGGGTCDARSQCESQCILNASCPDLQAALTGLAMNSYTTCDSACKTQ
jgi:hypothetical protein